MKKIILTGATGYIGRHVLEKLQKENCEIHVLVHNREPHVSAPNIETHRVNLLDEKETAEVMNNLKNFDVLIHAAWEISETYMDAPANEEWLRASKKLVDAFYINGGKRCVGLGTLLEYALLDGLCSEETTPINPSRPYTIAKNALHEYIKHRSTQEKKEYAWIRLFYSYGPHENSPKRIVPHIILSLMNNTPAGPMFGKSVRDYMYVEDAAEAIVKIALSQVQGPINVGTGKGIALNELALTIGNIMDKSQYVTQTDLYNPKEPQSIIADMKKFKENVGELSLTSMHEALEKTVAWHKSRQ